MSVIEATRQIEPLPRLESIVEFVRDHMRLEGSHDEGHLIRVLRHARMILERRSSSAPHPDRAVVAVAGLGHDLVNPPKDHPERRHASRRSADRMVEFVQTLEIFEASQLERLDEAIASHSFSGDREPQSIEAKIVCDADRLDALGAVGIARMFTVGGELNRPICHPDDPLAESRTPDDDTYTLDHAFEKLLTLRDRMHTEVGRRLAASRHAYLVDFLEHIRGEVTPDSGDGHSIEDV